MAEVPPGPSSVVAAAAPGDALCPLPGGGGAGAQDDEAAEEEEEEEGPGKGGPPPPRLLHPHPPHHNHQLNGLLSPELRRLRASLKSKVLSAEEGPVAAANHLPPPGRTAPPAAGAARNGLAGGSGPEEEEGEEEEQEEDEAEEEPLLLLTRSLAAGCSLKGSETDSRPEEDPTIGYVRYESELQMPDIMRLITKDLSEPYSIYTYRYFIHNWPQLCFLFEALKKPRKLDYLHWQC